jgi:type IV pilus assembly protein PilA
MSRTNTGTRKGFTLVELAVVIVIIGVLAAFGVPQFLKSVERSKAAEAFNYLAAVRAAQERYLAKNGYYYGSTAGVDATNGVWPADSTTNETLDINQSKPKYFVLGKITESHALDTDGKAAPTWELTLTRNGSSSYGAYEVTFDQNGYNATGGTAGTTLPISGFPEINPMGADVVSSSSGSGTGTGTGT